QPARRMGLAALAGNAHEQPGLDAVDQFAAGIKAIGDLADQAASEPLFGGALVADADIGVAPADIDLVVGGDQFEPEAVFDAPEFADVAGKKRRGPGAGGDPHDAFADGAILPAL